MHCMAHGGHVFVGKRVGWGQGHQCWRPVGYFWRGQLRWCLPRGRTSTQGCVGSKGLDWAADSTWLGLLGLFGLSGWLTATELATQTPKRQLGAVKTDAISNGKKIQYCT